MEDEAKRLGRELVESEEELDRAFESGGLTNGRIEELTAEIGRVEGRLRATHLAAHLAMTRILTPQQMSDYQRLRGYSGGGDPSASAAPHDSRGHPHLVSPQPP